MGVDEHVWRPGRYGADRDVTVMVDLTRGPDGRLHCDDAVRRATGWAACHTS